MILITRFEVYKSDDQLYNYRFVANDFRIFKSRGYKTHEECLMAIRRVKRSVDSDRFFNVSSIGNKCFFSLRLNEGESLGVSEMFNNPEDMEAAMVLVRYEAKLSPVVESPLPASSVK